MVKGLFGEIVEEYWEYVSVLEFSRVCFCNF